jgi:hypothetical protein
LCGNSAKIIENNFLTFFNVKKIRVLFFFLSCCFQVYFFILCFEVVFVFERFAKKKFGLLFLKSVVDYLLFLKKCW